jgi:hypothetical protein
VKPEIRNSPQLSRVASTRGGLSATTADGAVVEGGGARATIKRVVQLPSIFNRSDILRDQLSGQ